MLTAAAGVAWLGVRHLYGLGASWRMALGLIGGLSWRWPAVLAVVWMLGLCVHTVVLTASLPGLTHRRALTLNLSGSAVSNVLPLGGVAGSALNLGMLRGWGHTRLDFARFTVVSKAWDLIAKLLMPLVAVMLLGLHGFLWPFCAAASALAGLLVVAALLGRAAPLLRLVALAERIRGPEHHAWTDAAQALLAGTDRLVRQRWAELSWGMAGYWLLQGVLFWLCLRAVGAALPLPVVFAGLVTERALTLAALTPGGTGLVETLTVTVLIALGADPTTALAGVLLYRIFVFAAEIPVGGLATVFWLLGRRTA
jgi:uncharacterized membrane protein YbhN (UPF0104 family)